MGNRPSRRIGFSRRRRELGTNQPAHPLLRPRRSHARKTLYVTEESGHLTFAADVGTDGSLQNFHLFTNRGGENVASDTKGNVYIADGQIYVYAPSGKWLDTIRVPERPIQLIFAGPDRQTLFIAARSSLYSIRMQQPGR